MEVVIVDGGGKVTQDSMIDDDGAKVTAKKRGKKSSNSDKNKVDENRESEKPCTVSIYVTQCVFETDGQPGK